MALRTVLAVALLIVAVAAPPAAAQLLGGVLGNSNTVISGTVPCTTDTSTAITATTPVFPNATVLLQCGQSIVASTVTNSNGVFSLMIGTTNPLTQLLSSLLGGCKLVVTTPLSACGLITSSTTGLLQSALQLNNNNNGFLGGILGGITNIFPAGFKLV